MCSVVFLRRPGHPWPLLLAANRDERAGRSWRAPGRHWPDRPEIVAGLDLTAGGSWMGLNEDGLVACVLNRRGSLGPATGKRSRGELVLEALDHARAVDAALALADLDPKAYRSFNLLLADEEQAFWLRHGGDDLGIAVHPVPSGLSMLTAGDLNDPGNARIARFRPAFEQAAVPQPEAGADGWSAWQALLAMRDPAEPAAGMSVTGAEDFATVSSSLLALPRRPQTMTDVPRRPIWLFAAGAPDAATYEAVIL